MPTRLAHDWHDGVVPDNVAIDASAYLETSYCFQQFRGQADEAIRIGAASGVYSPTMFDVGMAGRVDIGAYCMLNGPRIICDSQVEIGDYALISWNVVLMDSYRFSADAAARRASLTAMADHRRRSDSSFILHPSSFDSRPIRIERNVWIGFDAVILPGVTIGQGAVIGARSVVFHDVPARMIVAGNPARVVREVPVKPMKQVRGFLKGIDTSVPREMDEV